MSDRKSISRRDAIMGLGLGAGAVFAGSRLPGWIGGLGPADAQTGTTTATATAGPAAACTLTPEVTEGPYWIPNKLTRRDVTDGQPGTPLSLHLYVEDASTCKPINGADVEIWHANAGGAYSGVNGNSKHWLRGHQKANAAGLAIFRTVYPGWYPGRTPHIHVKVHVGGREVHTGQLFFSDKVSAAVYAGGAYASHGQQDVKNSGDNIYAQAGSGSALLRLRKRAGRKGYVGTLTMGVTRS
jgi:protocatechuate 3,4-dioxygenase beta subunit